MAANGKEQHPGHQGKELDNSPIIEELVLEKYKFLPEEIDITMQNLISWKTSYIGILNLRSPLEYESLLESSGINPYEYESYYPGNQAKLAEVNGEILMRMYCLLQRRNNEQSAREFELMILDMPQLGVKDVIPAVKKFAEDGYRYIEQDHKKSNDARKIAKDDTMAIKIQFMQLLDVSRNNSVYDFL